MKVAGRMNNNNTIQMAKRKGNIGNLLQLLKIKVLKILRILKTSREWRFRVLILFRDLVVLFMTFGINLKVISKTLPNQVCCRHS